MRIAPTSLTVKPAESTQKPVEVVPMGQRRQINEDSALSNVVEEGPNGPNFSDPGLGNFVAETMAKTPVVTIGYYIIRGNEIQIEEYYPPLGANFEKYA